NAGLTVFHLYTVPGEYLMTLTAYNTDHPGGVTASVPIHIVALNQPVIQITHQANGYQLNIFGQADARYFFQYATNLSPSAWQTLQTTLGTKGPIQFFDPAPSDVLRFYRAFTVWP